MPKQVTFEDLYMLKAVSSTHRLAIDFTSDHFYKHPIGPDRAPELNVVCQCGVHKPEVVRMKRYVCISWSAHCGVIYVGFCRNCGTVHFASSNPANAEGVEACM